jgi:hypothetical protein
LTSSRTGSLCRTSFLSLVVFQDSGVAAFQGGVVEVDILKNIPAILIGKTILTVRA